MELDERLESGIRGRHSAAELLRAATADGYGSIGWPEAGRIAPGALADLVTVGLDGVRLAGTSPEHAVESVVFAAGAVDVRDVMVGGRVRGPRRGASQPRRGRRARRGDRHAAVMSSLAIDDIGLLVTNDPALGEGPLGIVRDAALVFEGDRVAAVERAGAAADRRFDAGGRCVIPGFVDSHTHLVFAGDRAEEFAARLAGKPYEASGITVTTEATRAASDERAPHPRRAAAGRGTAGRDHPPGGQVRLRARCRHRAAPLRDRLRAHRRRHLPRRACRSAGVRGPRRRLRRARLRRDARSVRAIRPLDRRLLRAGRLRRRAVARGPRGRAIRRPRAAGARQPARPGPRDRARRRDGCGLGGPLHLLRRRRRRGAGRRATPSPPSSPRRTSRPASPIRTRAA